MNLDEMVMSGLKKMSEEGKVQEIINKHLEKAIDDTVKDMIGPWSDFNKELKQHIKENLKINFNDLNLDSYNHLILKEVESLLNDKITQEGVAEIKERLEALLSDPKREYKLSELVKELGKEAEDLNELGYEEYKEMSMHIDDTYSSWHISLDSREDKSEYDCKYRLLITSEGRLASVRIHDKEYGRTRNVNEFDVKAVMEGLHGLEETLFKIYASGAKIIVDEDHCELSLSNPEYD